MAARFSYIHLSDAHFCIEPVRHNALSLMKRRPRDLLDTGVRQSKALGLMSLARPASYNPDIIAGVAQFCLERLQVSDGVIFTGDIATTGLMSDIDVAFSFLSEPAKAGFLNSNRKPTLNVSDRPIYVLPGNHDKYVDVRGTPNCRNFELKFERYMRNFKSGVGHWIRRKRDALLACVYADFSLVSRSDALDKAAGVFGQGRVYGEVLDELKNRSFELRRKYQGIHIIWAIHFAPYDCGYGLQLIDFSRVMDAAAALQIKATLCGHTHKAAKLAVDNHVVYCAGSAGCIDSEADSRVHVVHIDTDGEAASVNRDSFIWSAQRHEFVHHSAD